MLNTGGADLQLRLSEVLTEEQPYASRSLSSDITAEIPPLSASRLHKYANCASASYGATTYSIFSDSKTWECIHTLNEYFLFL